MTYEMEIKIRRFIEAESLEDATEEFEYFEEELKDVYDVYEVTLEGCKVTQKRQRRVFLYGGNKATFYTETKEEFEEQLETYLKENYTLRSLIKEIY